VSDPVLSADYVRLLAVAQQLYEALQGQYAHPFGVGQYKVTDAALAAFEAVAPTDENGA
jgi:hypothetical protein